MLETLNVMNGSVFKKIYGNVNKGICDISVFRRGVIRVFALLGFYAELLGSYLPKFRDNISVPRSRAKRTDWLFRNFGK
jgi:hypothetical protein